MTALIAALLVFAGVDGSPWEPISLRSVPQASAPAVRVAATGPEASVITAPTPPAVEASGPCAEWAPLAVEVGWPPQQWPTISRVMFCESRCDPAARNPSGASGLMQVMPFHWHGRDPLDPATNLTMALEVHDRQGWRAWSCY